MYGNNLDALRARWESKVRIGHRWGRHGERQVAVCVDCEDYPCARIRELGRIYPTLIADGERLKQVGLETWLQEQEQRSKTGFAYADIRNEE